MGHLMDGDEAVVFLILGGVADFRFGSLNSLLPTEARSLGGSGSFPAPEPHPPPR